jgi:hypothetical protein
LVPNESAVAKYLVSHGCTLSWWGRRGDRRERSRRLADVDRLSGDRRPDADCPNDWQFGEFASETDPARTLSEGVELRQVLVSVKRYRVGQPGRATIVVSAARSRGRSKDHGSTASPAGVFEIDVPGIDDAVVGP